MDKFSQTDFWLKEDVDAGNWSPDAHLSNIVGTLLRIILNYTFQALHIIPTGKEHDPLPPRIPHYCGNYLPNGVPCGAFCTCGIKGVGTGVCSGLFQSNGGFTANAWKVVVSLTVRYKQYAPEYVALPEALKSFWARIFDWFKSKSVTHLLFCVWTIISNKHDLL